MNIIIQILFLYYNLIRRNNSLYLIKTDKFNNFKLKKLIFYQNILIKLQFPILSNTLNLILIFHW